MKVNELLDFIRVQKGSKDFKRVQNYFKLVKLFFATILSIAIKSEIY